MRQTGGDKGAIQRAAGRPGPVRVQFLQQPGDPPFLQLERPCHPSMERGYSFLSWQDNSVQVPMRSRKRRSRFVEFERKSTESIRVIPDIHGYCFRILLLSRTGLLHVRNIRVRTPHPVAAFRASSSTGCCAAVPPFLLYLINGVCMASSAYAAVSQNRQECMPVAL